jgi:hypothetical protein
MEWLTATWLRLKALFRRVDHDLDDELAFHLAMREAKNRAAEGTFVPRRAPALAAGLLYLSQGKARQKGLS